jgi:hypothetical protein
MMVEMDIDSHTSVQGQDPSTTGNPQESVKAEAAYKINGGNSERTKSNRPRPQPVVGSAQPEDVQIEDITEKLELGWEEQPKAGTSSALVKRKGKQTHCVAPTHTT